MKQCEICYSENDGYSITRMDGYQVCIDCSEKIRKLSQEPRFGLSFGDRLTVQEFLRQTRG